MTMNLWVTDNQGKPIRGGSQIRGREGSIEIIKINHSLHLPYDPDTALIQGTRQHAPLTILKQLDQASPFFSKACSNGMNLKNIQLDLYQPNSLGQETVFYRYHLINVRIISIQPYFNSHCFIENVSFIYEKITWLFVNGHYSYSDSWTEK